MTKLIKLSKPACNPCTMLGMALDDLGVEVISYDITVDFDEAVKYGAMSSPILVLEDDEGIELERMVGYHPSRRGELEDLVAKLG